MGRNKFASIDDLLSDLDKDSILNEDDETELLDEEDLALLHGPTPPAPAPVKKPRKKSPAKPRKKKPVKK